MKNWTIKEAVNVINAGTDEAAIEELAKHFPMFFMAVAKNDLTALANAMGEKFTVRRLDFGGTDSDGDDDTDGAATETAAETEDVGDLNSMSTKQLMKLCDKRGIKVPHYGKNKQFYLDALNGTGAATSEDEGGDDDGDENPYAGKSAMELFKECKKRGVKCEAKKPAKYYVDLLLKADAAADDAGDGEDDWDDGDAEAEEPKKANAGKKGAVKGGKKSGGSKKAAKPAPAEDDADSDSDDDSDDWEI